MTPGERLLQDQITEYLRKVWAGSCRADDCDEPVHAILDTVFNGPVGFCVFHTNLLETTWPDKYRLHRRDEYALTEEERASR